MYNYTSRVFRSIKGGMCYGQIRPRYGERCRWIGRKLDRQKYEKMRERQQEKRKQERKRERGRKKHKNGRERERKREKQ